MSNHSSFAGQFDGQIAVITGSTQGLGEATARLMAERGLAGVVITGRNAERGQAVARDLNGIGCQAVFVQAELSDADACRRIMATADETFGTVHILVNAAALGSELLILGLQGCPRASHSRGSTAGAWDEQTAFWRNVRVRVLCQAAVRSGHILYRSPGTSFTRCRFP